MEIQPPSTIMSVSGRPVVFLAGTIDNGNSENWQKIFIEYFDDHGALPVFLNPRRDDWDSNLRPTKNNKKFKEQVDWELEGLEESDLVIFVFLPDSKSPVTLLELGRFMTKNCIVLCPNEYFRAGNVQIMCARYGVKCVTTFIELRQKFKEYLDSYLPF